MVINGPVATAGSILNRCSASGTNVPKSEANKITAISDMLTVIVKANESLNNRLNKNKIELHINPFSNATDNSLTNLCEVESKPKELLAKPCTIIELD